jgi:predicted ATPase
MAEASGNSAISMEARRSWDETLLFMGDFNAARTGVSWEQVTPDESGQRLVLDGAPFETVDPLYTLCFSARLLWYRGQPAQALQRINQALDLAAHMPDPFQLAFASSTSSQLHLMCGDLRTSQAHVERMLDIAEKRGYAYIAAGGVCFRGWLMANLHGRVDEGIAQIQAGLAQWRLTGAGLWQPYLLGLLADTHLRARQAQAGLAAVSEALSLSAANCDRFWEPELLRLQGELTWASVGPEAASASVLTEAERSLQNALNLARQQRAQIFALRTSLSLARLWATRGETASARELLASEYSHFTEGFDTADLAAARALLEQLTHAPASAITPKLARHSVDSRRRT